MNRGGTIKVVHKLKLKRVVVLQRSPISGKLMPVTVTHKIKLKPLKIWRNLLDFYR